MKSSKAVLTYANGVLSVSDGTVSAALSLGTFAATGGFHVSSDGNAGTKLTWS